MKLVILALALGLLSALSYASRDELRLAIWYGLKNTANDLDDYTIPIVVAP